VARPQLSGWSSTERQSPDGAVQFDQRVRLARPLVDLSEAGALRLAARYWSEVAAVTHGLVRARQGTGGVELRLTGRWTLLRFGAPTTVADEAGVLIRFPIVGGLLARAPGGAISLAQTVQPAVELRATIDGFFPRLGGRPGRPAWTGGLYRHVQSRIHTMVSRRYFLRLIGEEAT
jgi:hypothetical protein